MTKEEEQVEENVQSFLDLEYLMRTKSEIFNITPPNAKIQSKIVGKMQRDKAQDFKLLKSDEKSKKQNSENK